MQLSKLIFSSVLLVLPTTLLANTNSQVPQYLKQNRANLLLPSEQSAESILESLGDREIQPFGASSGPACIHLSIDPSRWLVLGLL